MSQKEHNVLLDRRVTRMSTNKLMLVVAIGATIPVYGCAPLQESLLGVMRPKKHPATVQINYQTCRDSERCTSNMEAILAMKESCVDSHEYDCSQYDPLLKRLDGMRKTLLARESAEEVRVEQIRKEAQLRHDESVRIEKEKDEKRERDIQDRIQQVREARRLSIECDNMRSATKRMCDSWISNNCKPVLVSRTGCQQIVARDWGQVTSWTECIDTYKASCVNEDTKPQFCSPEAPGGEVVSNSYLDQCAVVGYDH